MRVFPKSRYTSTPRREISGRQPFSTSPIGRSRVIPSIRASQESGGFWKRIRPLYDPTGARITALEQELAATPRDAWQGNQTSTALLQKVNALRELYNGAIQSVREDVSGNRDPGKMPHFHYKNLAYNGDSTDQGEVLRTEYGRGAGVIGNRGNFASHNLLALSRMGFIKKVGVTATPVDAKYKTSPLHDPSVTPLPLSDYRNIDEMVAATVAFGGDFIDPGYGFNAENPKFSAAAERAGIKFIGANAEAMERLADKNRAKDEALKARNKVMEMRSWQYGFEVIPGPVREVLEGEGRTRTEHITFPYDLRFPGPESAEKTDLQVSLDWAETVLAAGKSFLIKAVAGGGGKGIKSVTHTVDFVPQLHAAYREVSAAFGEVGEEPQFILEESLKRPDKKFRHIELQVFSFRPHEVDQGGKRQARALQEEDKKDIEVHLRDCSLQDFKHQKIMERTVSDLPAEAVELMTEVARELMVSTNYDGYCTVEGLWDGKTFYFLEVNTRIQVEAIVTGHKLNRNLAAERLGARVGYRPTELAKAGHSQPRSGEVAQIRLTGRAGIVESVHLAKGEGITPFTFLRDHSTVAPGFDAQIGAYLVEAPDLLTLLLKIHAVVQKTEIHGHSLDDGDLPYLWDKESILQAIDHAIQVVIRGETPDIDLISDFIRSQQDGSEVRASYGGEVHLKSAPVAGRFPLEKGICVSRGETLCATEAMKNNVAQVFGAEFGRITEVLIEDGKIAETGQTLVRFTHVSEDEFIRDRQARLEKLTGANFAGQSVAMMPRVDRALAEILRNAFEDLRFNGNADWQEVDASWQPGSDWHLLLSCKGRMQGIRIFEAPDRSEYRGPEVREEWFARPLAHDRRRLVFVTPMEWKLREAEIAANLGKTVPSPFGYKGFVTPLQEVAAWLTDGKSEESKRLRDRMPLHLSPPERYLLSRSPDHYKPEALVEHWRRSGKVTKVVTIPTEDRAFAMWRLTLSRQYGGYDVLVMAQKMGGSEVNFGMMTEDGYRDMVQVFRSGQYRNLPALLIANTIGADPTREPNPDHLRIVPGHDFYMLSEETSLLKVQAAPPKEYLVPHNINLGISRGIVGSTHHVGPVASLVWGGASGGAEPFLKGNIVFAGEITGNASVIGPAGCRAILGDKELSTDDAAAIFMQMTPRDLLPSDETNLGAGLVTPPLLKQPFEQDSWRFDGPAFYDHVFEAWVQTHLNEVLGWHGMSDEIRFQEGMRARTRRIDRHSRFGLHAGYLKAVDLSRLREDLVTRIPVLEAPPQDAVLRMTVPDPGREGKPNYVSEIIARGLRFESETPYIPMAPFVLFGLLGRMIRRYQRFPDLWVSIVPGSYIDTAWDRRKREGKNQDGRIGGLMAEYFPDEPISPTAEYLIEDHEGNKALVMANNYSTGTHPVVGQKEALTFDLAAKMCVPRLRFRCSQGMRMGPFPHLESMGTMAISAYRFHAAIPELQKQNPLVSDMDFVIGDAYGGDTASVTAEASQLFHHQVAWPDRQERPPFLGGLYIFGKDTRIGFSGPRVVKELAKRNLMIKLQRGEVWENTFLAAVLDPDALLEIDSIPRLLEFCRALNDARRQAYWDAFDRMQQE